MVVDRGGLRYPVEVIDLFSKNLQKFRTELRLSRAEFTKFRRQSRLATQQVSKQEISQRKEAAQASKVEAKAERDRAQQVAAGARQLKQVQDLRARMFRNERTEREKTERSVARAASRQRRAAQQQALVARKAAAAQSKLGKEVKVTDNAAQKLLFTFRRLVGVLALFTIARQVSQGFIALVKSGFEFNQTVERTRLGIAGIVVAVGQVRNEQGRLLKGAEAFVAAQTEARRQQQLLRQDALSTVATFQELLDAFQIAIGPGLAAGFDLNQVRQFSVLISQAASNIGLPQRQLSEEIRAILTGNIRQTTTRIAQVLNLTNQEIRELKAQGADVFFAELQKRLQGFALGAQAAAQTVGGLFVRLKDVIELVAGTAAKDAFEELRSTLQQLFEALTDVEKTEVGELLKPAPEAQAAFSAIFNAINGILKRATALGRTIGLDGLTNSAQLFANVLEVIGTLVVDILAGATRGFSTLQTLLEPVIEAFQGITNLLPEGAANELLVTLIQVATVLFSLKIGFIVLTGTAGRLLGILTGIPAVMSLMLVRLNTLVATTLIWVRETKFGLLPALNLVRSRAFLIAGAFGLAVLATTKLAASLLGIELQLRDVPEALGAAFERAFTETQIFANKVKLGDLSRQFLDLADEIRAELKDALSPEQFKTIEKLQPADLINLPALEKALAPVEGQAPTNLFKRIQGIVKTLRESEGVNIKLNALARERTQLQLEINELTRINAQTEDDANANFDKRIEKLKEEIAEREKLAKKIQEDAKKGGVTITGPEQLTETTKAAIAILTSAVQQFATFVSDTIVDAFDPTKDTNIKERFARFLQSIAKMILQTFIQLAIQRAILFAFFPGGAPAGLFGAGGAKGGPIGRRKGGRIPGRQSQASLAHYTSGRGMIGGGKATPPKGVDKKDNIPIWAQEGEYMMRLSAVQKYGLGIMEALNRGLIDPGELASMAGTRKVSRNSRRRVGFQTGGQIASQAETAASSVGAGASPGEGSSGLGAALLVANDTTAERLLAGGKKAVLDFIDEHGADIDGRLARFRS